VIFATVGTQLPFDRLIEALDAWAASHPAVAWFAQIGKGARRPAHLTSAETLSFDDVDRHVRSSDVVISHVGMGSILTALRFRKPIIVFPRRAALGEHRNDHQLATAKWLARAPYRGVSVAWTTDELYALLDRRDTLAAGDAIDEFAEPAFLARLSSFIAR
jgi:UDP-N-acetylglucosamine transferase subunit ALG13